MTTAPTDRYIRAAKIDRVIDGDTIDLLIDLGWSMTLRERIRLSGAQAPESRGEEAVAGAYVANKVRAELLEGLPVLLESQEYKRERYGRTVGRIYRLGGWCVNDWLLDQKLAWPTDQRGAIVGPRDLTLLTGIPK